MTTIDATGDQPRTLTTAARLRSILGGSLGNLVEWYDWYTYPSFALYFSKMFFPQGDQTAQLLNAAMVFGLGFLVRPLGGWIMGRYADKVGRRPTLILSMWIMGFGSLAVGLIPSYNSIGVFSPILLVIARIIQGLSIGGQYAASASYLSEVAGRKRRGFWTSFHYVTLLMGLFLAMVVLLVLQQTLSPAELSEWGWRIPFFLGAVLAVGALWLILGIQESTSFETTRNRGAPVQPWKLMGKHIRELVIVFVITAAGTISFQTYATYMPKFLVNTSGFTPDSAAQLTTVALVIYMLMHPLMGWLSDIVGRKPLLIAFSVLGMIFTVPILSTMATTHDVMTAFLLQVAALAIICPYSTVSALFKSEMFPTEIRALAVGLSFTTAVSLFGGTAELIALTFKKMSHENFYFWYISGAFALSLIAAVVMREPQTNSLITDD